jgi:DNA adenine methylase
MKYMGSKRRIAKEILPIILKDRKPGQLYVEPFLGGGNSFECVSNPRLGSDVNHYVVAYLEALSNGWLPPRVVSEDLYRCVKANKDFFKPEIVAFVGLDCSFGSKWFGGYARDKTGKRNYAREGHDNAVKNGIKLSGATFQSVPYNELEIPDGSIVYCDPPYEGTTAYRDDFDHYVFWQWAAELSKRCTVFVSEYNAPPEWECVWQQEQLTHMDNGKKYHKRVTEKLFKLKGA